MVRSRVALSVVGMLWAASAEAQPSLYTGILTGHVGVVAGGDVTDSGATLGASIAVIEASGLGAEIDLGHARRFNSEFAESGITSLMLNAIGIWRDVAVRPFIAAGVGFLRARVTLLQEQSVVTRTDWGFNAGGGLLYLFNDALGLRGDVRYFRYFQRHDDLPLADNGFFDFWRTSVGVTYAWPIR